mmetsp:Transcript_44532/g.100711  ORF Transcript_44532/g.100711 Transcript_44532/m.100711 type:complete len:602 (-) Transcript_44532:55-1860(-)
MCDAEVGLCKAPDAYAPVAGSLLESEECEPLQQPRVGIRRPAVLAAALATAALAAVALWGSTHSAPVTRADSAAVARFEVEQQDTVFDADHADGADLSPGGLAYGGEAASPSTYAVLQQQAPGTSVVDQGLPATLENDVGYDGQSAPAMDETTAALATQNALLRNQNELLKAKLTQEQGATDAEGNTNTLVPVSHDLFDSTSPQAQAPTSQETFDATAVLPQTTQAPSQEAFDATTAQPQEIMGQPGFDTRDQGFLSPAATDAGNGTPSSEVGQRIYVNLNGSTAAPSTSAASIYASEESASGVSSATGTGGIEAGAKASSMAAGGYPGVALRGGTVTRNPWVEAAEKLAMASSQITVTMTTTPMPTSLFCFSVMMPHSYEVDLMKSTLEKGVGIFGCEAYTVLSSEDVELSPGPPVRIGTENIGSLKCGYGGPWHLALNSEIFVHAWKKVFEDGTYLNHAWTIKADPDAVFLSSRLRDHVRHSHPEESVYLNNCDQGLHGPIEVIGRGGMETFRKGISKCIKKLKDEFTWSGEDVFLRHCLGMLKVNRVDDFKLLSDKACLFEDPVSQGCFSGKVSFHPFKTAESYFKCLEQSEESSDKH